MLEGTMQPAKDERYQQSYLDLNPMTNNAKQPERMLQFVQWDKCYGVPIALNLGMRPTSKEKIHAW